ncbi:MAG: hypothetical protein ACQEXV_12655 [Bacillota bacterium]
MIITAKNPYTHLLYFLTFRLFLGYIHFSLALFYFQRVLQTRFGQNRKSTPNEGG